MDRSNEAQAAARDPGSGHARASDTRAGHARRFNSLRNFKSGPCISQAGRADSQSSHSGASDSRRGHPETGDSEADRHATRYASGIADARCYDPQKGQLSDPPCPCPTSISIAP